jgi:hypothetical protein
VRGNCIDHINAAAGLAHILRAAEFYDQGCGTAPVRFSSRRSAAVILVIIQAGAIISPTVPNILAPVAPASIAVADGDSMALSSNQKRFRSSGVKTGAG